MKIGDVVMLKSGGPKMTVIELPWDGQPELVACVWFDSIGCDHFRRFLPKVLILESAQSGRHLLCDRCRTEYSRCTFAVDGKCCVPSCGGTLILSKDA